jgi:hypothetical protein
MVHTELAVKAQAELYIIVIFPPVGIMVDVVTVTSYVNALVAADCVLVSVILMVHELNSKIALAIPIAFQSTVAECVHASVIALPTFRVTAQPVLPATSLAAEKSLILVLTAEIWIAAGVVRALLEVSRVVPQTVGNL